MAMKFFGINKLKNTMKTICEKTGCRKTSQTTAKKELVLYNFIWQVSTSTKLCSEQGTDQRKAFEGKNIPLRKFRITLLQFLILQNPQSVLIARKRPMRMTRKMFVRPKFLEPRINQITLSI